MHGYFMENPMNIWMMTGGTSILGNFRMIIDKDLDADVEMDEG
jgi:hypothetical protein